MTTKHSFVCFTTVLIAFSASTQAQGLSRPVAVIGEQHFFSFDPIVVSDTVARIDGEELVWGVAPPNGSGFGLRSLALLGDQILVADQFADMITTLSLDGTPRGLFASVDQPLSIETDSSGHVYAASLDFRNSANNAISRFDSSGTLEISFIDGNLDAPVGVDADQNGNIYVADGRDAELFKFDPNGNLLGKTTYGGLSFGDVSIDEEGQRLFIGSTFGDGLHVFDISGPQPIMLSTIDAPIDFFSPVEFAGISYDPFTGHVFAAGGLSVTLHEYDENLQLLASTPGRLGDVQQDIVALPIPEPTSLWLASGLALAAAWRPSQRAAG